MSDDPRCYVCKKAERDDPEVELRPYGPNASFICFDCMISDPLREADAHRQFGAQLDAAGAVAIIGDANGPRPLEKSRG